MLQFMYLELNAFSLAVLALILYNASARRRDQLLTEQRLFLLFVYADAVILILDTAMWLLSGKPGRAAMYINVAATALYYAMNPAICYIWHLYVDFLIHKSDARLKKIALPSALPAASIAVLSLLSTVNGALFYFDENDVYHRGELFYVMAAVSFAYLLFTWIQTVLKRRMLPRHEFIPLAVLMLPVIACSAVQTAYFGVSLIWPCVTFSILVLFIAFQNTQIGTDHLTGLSNRRHLDRFLHQKLQGSQSGKVAGLLIDIDSFKSINDRFGHDVGDQALVDTAGILKKTFRKNDFISRYGGDEFVVVMEVHDEGDLQKAIQRLDDNVRQFNAGNTSPYTISLSVGYDYFDGSLMDAGGFLRRLDNLMYRDKKSGPA